MKKTSIITNQRIAQSTNQQSPDQFYHSINNGFAENEKNEEDGPGDGKKRRGGSMK